MALARLRQATVRRDHGERVRHDARHVFLVHGVEDRAGAASPHSLDHELGAGFRGGVQAFPERPVPLAGLDLTPRVRDIGTRVR